MKYTQQQKKEAQEYLTKIITQNSQIYGAIVKVAPNGISRCIKFYTVKDNCIILITHEIAILTDNPQDRATDGIRVSGCGMDIIFATIYKVGKIGDVDYKEIAQKYILL
jgi:hypothetical protein